MNHEQASDIICTAIENNAIGGWAEISQVNYKNGVYISFFVGDGDPDETGKITEKITIIDKNSLESARMKLLTEDVDIHRTIAAQFVGPAENWDYDVVGVDALVQIVLFGKVVYG